MLLVGFLLVTVSLLVGFILVTVSLLVGFLLVTVPLLVGFILVTVSLLVGFPREVTVIMSTLCVEGCVHGFVLASRHTEQNLH